MDNLKRYYKFSNPRLKIHKCKSLTKTLNLARLYRCVSLFWIENLITILDVIQLWVISITVTANINNNSIYSSLLKDNLVSLIIFPSFICPKNVNDKPDCYFVTYKGIQYVSFWLISTILLSIFLCLLLSIILFLIWRECQGRSYISCLKHSTYLVVTITMTHGLLACLPIVVNWFDFESNVNRVIKQVTTLIVTFLTVTIPLSEFIYLHLCIRKTHSCKNHQEYIEQRELEFMLKLNENWNTESLFIYSSFKPHLFSIYHSFIINLVKILVIVFYSFIAVANDYSHILKFESPFKLSFSPIFIYNYDSIIPIALFVFYAVYLILFLIFPVYRCKISSYIHFFLFSNLLVSSLYIALDSIFIFYAQLKLVLEISIIILHVSLLSIVIFLILKSLFNTFEHKLNLDSESYYTVSSVNEFSIQKVPGQIIEIPTARSSNIHSEELVFYLRHSPWPVNPTAVEVIKQVNLEIFNDLRSISYLISHKYSKEGYTEERDVLKLMKNKISKHSAELQKLESKEDIFLHCYSRLNKIFYKGLRNEKEGVIKCTNSLKRVLIMTIVKLNNLNE